jgi:hypothetical protein
MFGWSIGGAGAAQAMHDDPRIKAGVNMDGTFWGSSGAQGVKRALGAPPGALTETLGTIRPKTAITDERTYIRAFFDTYLRHRDNHLLDGPSPCFPDISFES